MQRPLKVVPGKGGNAVWIDAINVTKVELLYSGVLRLTVKGEPGPGTIDVSDRGLINEVLAILGIAVESSDDANADLPGI